ncbi:SH3 and PX domain-containing protein 2A-like isoform X6 [Ostrea edulis]|uniref:SH3 and PX domain-containing protein 2A-like isoform X6 n=1 Tax=Ostrea edulis TaxID=37623 RepID=UPI0024AF17A4|nr:SH3 and PX domain-containing protein 2A-like isoform X6 [Ostrea edulis]
MANSTVEVLETNSNSIMSSVADLSSALSTNDPNSSSVTQESSPVTVDVSTTQQSVTSMSLGPSTLPPSSDIQTISPSRTLSPSFMPNFLSDSQVSEISQLPTPLSASQETTSTALQETTSTALHETTSTALQETTSTALQETTSTALQETTSTALQETTSTASQETTSTALQESSADLAVTLQSSSDISQLSVSPSSDIVSEVTSSILSSTPVKHTERLDSVSSLYSPTPASSQSSVTITSALSSIPSSALSSSVSESSIIYPPSTLEQSSDSLSPRSTLVSSSTQYSPSLSLMSSSTHLQSSSSKSFMSSTPTLILPSSTKAISTDPVEVIPTSSMKTYSPTTILPVLPASGLVLPGGDRPTTEQTNNTVTTTAAPLLGTGLELIIALSIIGAGLFIFFIIVVCICCRKKKPRKQEKYEPNAATEDLWVSRSEVPLNHVDSLPQVKTYNEVDGGSIKLRNGITHFNTATVRRSYSPAFRHTVRFFDEVEEKYVAMYNFEGKDEECLTLKEGDVVVVTNKNDSGWWTGSLDGKTGVFPGSYVKEVPPEVDFQKNNRLSNGTQPFEISLDVDTNVLRPVSSFMSPDSGFTKRASTLQKDSSKGSTLTRHTLGKEVPIPHIPDEQEEDEDKNSVKRRSTISPVKEDCNVDGVQFKVLFNYTANWTEELSLQEGEIVTGIKKDRNGWMYGRRNRTNEVGNFPTVYVEKATKEDIEAASFSQHGYPDKETVYRQLQVNRTSHHDEDLIGIEHRALHYYAAEDEHDLSFDKGDTIIVYEVNENGWWKGSHGDEVGWFPGSYVELVDEDPTELKYKGPGELTIRSDDRIRSSSFLSVGSATNISKTSDEETGSVCSTGTTDSRRRPVRKAPPPPVDLKSPRTPTTKQPPRPPSLVPWAIHTESTPNDKSANWSRDFSPSGSCKSISESDSVDGAINTSRSLKPEVPKRFIKPKLVKISKKKINLKPSSSSVRASKSPPPPRPDFPKHIPKSPLNRSKDESNQYSKLNGTANSFTESQDMRSNSQNNSAVTDSDISGVEALQFSSSEKDQSSVQNKSENEGAADINSEPKSREQNEQASGLSSFKNKSKELSPNEARHSTPKYHATPNFSDSSLVKSKKMNGSVDANSSVPETETSITEVSGLDETDGDVNSPKVPPSPKRSRLPMLSGIDAGANVRRARSKERPPPVAPKPINRKSQIQRLRSLERSQSEVENSSHDQSSLQDDSSSILIHDGLDSSNNNSTHLNDSHNQSNSTSQIKKSSTPVQQNPQKFSAKQTTNSSRIPKTASGATKRPGSAVTGKPSENSDKNFSKQTSATSQGSGGFPEMISPGKPPTPKPKRPDNPPNKSDSQTPTRRKTSASPSRIPLGKSPTRKPSDSGAKTKIPQNHSPNKKSSNMDVKSTSKIPTIPSTNGQRNGLPKTPPVESPSSRARALSTDSPKGSPSKRGQSSIPKPPRPSKPFIPLDEVGAGGDNSTAPSHHRLQLKKAVSGYEALNEFELSFSEGSLITVISEDADNPGWCVGRLPDGTTGRYHASFVEDLPLEGLTAV